jgi:predicted nucleotidyltransferase
MLHWEHKVLASGARRSRRCKLAGPRGLLRRRGTTSGGYAGAPFMRLHRTLHEPKLLTAEGVAALGQRLAAACLPLPVRLLYLHGSHARGTQGPLSDLDLAVLFAPGAARDVSALSAVVATLEDVSGRDDVDLVVLDSAGALIKDRVVRGGRLLFARSEVERIRFEAAAIKEALDFRHYARVYDDALFRQIAAGRFP